MKVLFYPIAAAALLFAVNASAAHVDVQVGSGISTLDIAYDYAMANSSDRQKMSMDSYPVAQLTPWLQSFNDEIQNAGPDSTISFGSNAKPLTGCQKIPLKAHTVITINPTGCVAIN